ncbi:MAG: lactate racemization operon protein LarA, partial [Clostridiales bacterium]|nr:lactate racemization operon protein LarA [Clostridiales bacterium]
ARILSRRRVILISRADPELVRRFGIVPACDFPDALRQADTLAGEDARILVVPEGVSVIPQLD